jgi:O-antigen/teichoic acid export membrane protein
LSLVGLVALGGTRLIHGSLVSRATDHETYAVVGTLIGLAMAAGLFLPNGLASAASRFIPFLSGRGDPGAARTAYRVLTVSGYACALVFGAIIGAIAVTLPGVSTGDALAVAALTAIYSAYSVAKGALYGFDRVVPYTWLELAGSIVTVGATVVVVASGAHAYLVPLTAGYAVLMLGALVVLRRRHDPAVIGPASEVGRDTSGNEAEGHAKVAGLDRRELATFVGLASVGGVASAGLLQVLPVLAGRFTNPTEVAYLVAAVTLVAPLFLLPRALSLALFPAMARAHGAGETDVVRRHADISTRALLALLAPLFGAAILVAPEVLVLFGGPSYREGADVLRVLLLATYVGSIQVAAVNSLSSGDGLRISVYSAVIGSVVGLVAVAPLGHWFGATGVAVAYLVAAAVTSAGPLAVAWRRFHMDWTGATVRSLAVVLAAIVVAAIADAVHHDGIAWTLIDVFLGLGMVAAGGALLRCDIMRVIGARRGNTDAIS